MRTLFILLCASLPAVSFAQAAQQQSAPLNYNYAELRYVDVDSNGGDGFRFNGSFELENNWIIVGGLTSLDFNGNVDLTTIELGGGYVWNYNRDFDFLATLRYINVDVDTTGGSADDSGFAFSAGTRGFLAPQFEIRGSVNHVNLDNSDTYLELGGDYYFSRQFSAGITLEFAGDTDVFTIGGRWFFK